MIEFTPFTLDLPGAPAASRVRALLARACTPPAPCRSAAVVAPGESGIELLASVGPRQLERDEEDAARLAARSGVVVVIDEHEEPVVAAPAGDGLAVVVRLRHEAVPERVERIEALAESVALALDADGLSAVRGREERAAYDLHDGPSQKLVWARNALRDRETSLETVREVLDSAVADLQRVIAGLLDPTAASVPPLELLVREELELAERRSGVKTILDVPPDPLPELDPAVAETAYRLVQEAVGNAVRHAGASQVSVRLACDVACLSLSVCDDGTGFDVAATNTGGLGLRGMRRRVRAAGGSLRVTSTPARGTRVRARLPRRFESAATG